MLKCFSRRFMDFFKFILVMIILLCVPSHVENSKGNYCSLKGLDFQQCLNHQVQSADSFEACCQTLSQAVQAGYSCLCSLLRSSTPIIGIALSLQLSNCYIFMPSLAHCHKPPLAPPAPELTPVPLARPPTVPMPPEIPKEPPQPSAPNDLFGPLSPKMNDIPLNPSPIKNSTMSTGQPTLNSNTFPEPSIPQQKEKICSGGDTSNPIINPGLLLALVAICAIM